MNTDNLPRRIYSGAYRTPHCQGIAVDLAKGYIYYSFTTMLVKTDLAGRFVGSVKGLTGHLGCIAFHPESGRVYGSLEYKNDVIGRGIARMLGTDQPVSDRFYVAMFDVDRITEPDMEAGGIMRASFLRAVTEDYLTDVRLGDGRVVKHRFGCSGIDGCAAAPDFGEPAESKNWIFVAYGIYSDISRDDNDHQIILKYDPERLWEVSEPLDQACPHTTGPDAPDSRYFVYTGNTTYGVQNLEYDPATRKFFLCVYPGKKPGFKNPPLFLADAAAKPHKGLLRGVVPPTEGELLSLDAHGTDGVDFPHGSTGIAALGDGYFYISHEGAGPDGQYTEVRLWRLKDGKFELPA